MILAVIALITVPLVYKMVNKAKEELSIQNVEGYINAAEIAVSKHGFDSDDDVSGVYDITQTGIKKQGTDLEFAVNVKGDRPTSGTITFDEDANVIAVNIPVSDSKSIVMDDQGRLKKVTVTNPGEELEEGKLFIRETLNGTIQVKVNDVLQDSLEIAYQKGDKVTITFVPNDGYILEDYTCEFLSGNLKGNNNYDKVMESLKEYEIGASFQKLELFVHQIVFSAMGVNSLNSDAFIVKKSGATYTLTAQQDMEITKIISMCGAANVYSGVKYLYLNGTNIYSWLGSSSTTTYVSSQGQDASISIKKGDILTTNDLGTVNTTSGTICGITLYSD